MYHNGDAVMQDYEKAVFWYQKAANQDIAEAKFNLGVAYANNYGVTQNKKEAVKWYKEAAEQGHAPSQHNLGLAYYHGNGVTQDTTKAVKWLTKAAQQGFAEAQKAWMKSTKDCAPKNHRALKNHHDFNCSVSDA